MIKTNLGINQMHKGEMMKESKEIAISATVVYRYWETNGKRTGETLVASERYYPGVLVGKRFYYGISAGNRFIPGVIWCNHFIPGLVTKNDFVPGIIIDNSFQPGIINAGIFLPGIVSNSTFVPGVIQEKKFIPGCHTTDEMFAPGRIWNRQFESGITERHCFIRANRVKLFREEVSSLPREGYGMTQVRHLSPIGGVPIMGMILGEFNDGHPWYLSCGLLTDDGLVIGGVPVFDDTKDLPREKPGTAINELLDRLGIDKYGHDFDNKGKEILKDIEDWSDSMLGTSNPFKPTGSGPSIATALDVLGQGSSDLIDTLNEDYNNYWKHRIDSASGWLTGSMAYGPKGERIITGSMAIGAAIGILAGAGIGKTVPAIITGGTAGLALGNFVGRVIVDIIEPDAPPPPGTKQPGEEGAGGANNVLFGRGLVGPEGLYQEIKGPKDRKIYEWKNTECGRVLVVDRQELRKAVISAPQGSSLGLNVLTGQTTWVHLEPPTTKEIQDHVACEMMKKIITDPIFHPGNDEVGGGG